VQKEALQKLMRTPGCHPVVGMIREWRTLKKSRQFVVRASRVCRLKQRACGA